MVKKKNFIVGIFAVVVLVSLTVGIVSAAPVSQSITYQGKLTDAAGNPLTGTYTVTFKLYELSSGGSALATDTHTVQASKGVFTTQITADTGFFDGRALWLGITVGADAEMTPRQEIRPVPYALSLRPGALINANGNENGIRVNKSDKGGEGILAYIEGPSSSGFYSIVKGTSSNGFRAVTYGNGGSGMGVATHGVGSTGVSSHTWGTGSHAITASTESDGGMGLNVVTSGGGSNGVKAVTGGTGSHGVWGEATGPASNGVVAISQQSPALWAETFADKTASISTRTTKNGGRGVETYNYGPNSSGFYVSTSGTNSPGLYALTSGVGSQGVFTHTTGTGSKGVYAQTSGSNSVGVNGATTGIHSKAIVGTTKGTDSDGMYAWTDGSGSNGMTAITNGFMSNGVQVSTHGYQSYGLASSTGGEYSTGIQTETNGQYSAGVNAHTNGPHSKGINAISNQASAIWAETGRSDNKYGVQTPDIIRALSYETGASDVAEYMSVTGEVSPGTILVIGPDGKLQPSTSAYDTGVAGIVSTAPGVSLGAKEGGNPGEQLIAVAGRVPCKVDTSGGPIHPRDLLTTSDNPGYAMKATNPQIGTVLGKAMGTLESGTGTIEVLVTLQ